MKINLFYAASNLVDYCSEKPGVDSSILSLATIYTLNPVTRRLATGFFCRTIRTLEDPLRVFFTFFLLHL